MEDFNTRYDLEKLNSDNPKLRDEELRRAAKAQNLTDKQSDLLLNKMKKAGSSISRMDSYANALIRKIKSGDLTPDRKHYADKPSSHDSEGTGATLEEWEEKQKQLDRMEEDAKCKLKIAGIEEPHFSDFDMTTHEGRIASYDAIKKYGERVSSIVVTEGRRN